jgi:hypothetical protein
VSRSAGQLKPPQGKSGRRLISDQQYFGLEAGVLRSGAKRTLARVTDRASAASIDVRSLGADFHLDGPGSAALLSEFLAGGMLYPDGTGSYRPTRLFREYALASVVAPLARERAKALVERACALAAASTSSGTTFRSRSRRWRCRELHDAPRAPARALVVADPLPARRIAQAASSHRC